MTENAAFQTSRLRWTGPVWIALMPALPALACQFGHGAVPVTGAAGAATLLLLLVRKGQSASSGEPRDLSDARSEAHGDAVPGGDVIRLAFARDEPANPDPAAAGGHAVAPLAALIKGQVDGVHETVGSAVAGVVGEVEEVHRHAGVQLQGIHRLLDNTSTLDRVAQVPGEIIGRLEEMLSSRDETLEHNFAGLQALATQFETLRGTVDTITQVADKAFFLSINAAVEAKRHGSAGAAFGLIADEMRRLATQSADTARVVSDGIHEFAGQMHQQIARALPDQAGGKDAISRLVQDMGAAQAALQANGAALSREVALIDEGHRTIVLHLSGILGGLQFHDVIRQRLEQVADLLVQLEQECRAPANAARPLEQRLADLMDQADATYVMAAQRKVHQAVLGGGGGGGGGAGLALAADDPPIELF